MNLSDYFERIALHNTGKAKKLIIALLRNPPDEKSLSDLVPEIRKAKDLNQEHPVHNLDLYEHTIKVIKGLPNNSILLRLVALFHDLGKIYRKTKDSNNDTHYYLHEEASMELASKVLSDLGFNTSTKNLVLILIKYHDTKFEADKLNVVISMLGNEFIEMFKKEEIEFLPDIHMMGIMIMESLFTHMLSDLKAHSPGYMQRKLPKVIELMNKLQELK